MRSSMIPLIAVMLFVVGASYVVLTGESLEMMKSGLVVMAVASLTVGYAGTLLHIDMN